MTTTLDLTAASAAELRAECDRLGLTYRSKDDRKALARKITHHVFAQSEQHQPGDVRRHEPVTASTFENAVLDVLNGADPDVVADALLGEQPVVDRVERMKLATAEHKALKAWRKAGAKGTPPATPNLDVINAETSTGPRKANGAKQAAKRSSAKRTTSSTSTPSTATSERYAAARKIMATSRAAGERRTGTKMSDDDVKAYIVDTIKAFPDATCGGELLVARWASGMSMDRYRWNTLWAEVAAR